MNNKAPILQVIMSLFSDAPYIEGEFVKLTDSQELLRELQKTGLNASAIDQALTWVERFSKLHDENQISYHPETVRIFTHIEKAVIPTECLCFLLESHLTGDIASYELEFIIEQIMTLGTHTITEEQFMWIFDMTIANQEDDLVEYLISLDDPFATPASIH